jgi:hypothetical protein
MISVDEPGEVVLSFVEFVLFVWILEFVVALVLLSGMFPKMITVLLR